MSRADDKRPPLVIVDWLDSTHRGGWQYDHDENEPLACRTVGWLLKRSRAHVVVAQSHTTNQYADAMTIPRGCLKRVTKLRER